MNFSRAGACRVCLKSFKPDDYSKTCIECEQRVCEDCATSYAEFEDPVCTIFLNTHSDNEYCQWKGMS